MEADVELDEGEPEDPENWEPDRLLVAAVLAGESTATMNTLCPSDQAWVVAGLGLAGLTVDQIADRLKCCRRKVCTVRGHSATKVMGFYQRETENFADELRLRDSSVAEMRARCEALGGELARVKAQRDRMIDEKITGIPSFNCGHTREKHNVYVQESTGREFCRTCHADRQRTYRANRRAVDVGAVLEAVELDLSESVIQERVTTALESLANEAAAYGLSDPSKQ